MRLNPTLLGFIKKEFKQVLRDPKMRIILFVAPVIQMTLFGTAISTEVKNVRLAAQRSPDDTVLNHVYEHSLASTWFIPAEVTSQDPFQQIQTDEADAVLVPPPGGLSRAIERGEGRLQLLVNATNVIRAQSIEQYVQSILSSVLANDRPEPSQVPPIDFSLRILFNPTMRTAVYMVPGVMGMLICIITILLTSMSISKEKEVGTFEMLISAPISTHEIILGKTLPYVVLGMSNVPLILGVAVFVFQVPMRGNLLVLLLSAFVFVCSTVAVGTLISTISRTQQQSMMGGFIFLFPAIQLSGAFFPLENMPFYMKLFAYVNPLTYFLELIRNIMLKGGGWQLVLKDLVVLTAIAIALTWMSFRRFRTTLS